MSGFGCLRLASGLEERGERTRYLRKLLSDKCFDQLQRAPILSIVIDGASQGLIGIGAEAAKIIIK
jgi:hypothetical protein